MDPDEAAILRRRLAMGGKAYSLTASRRRQDRLRKGGPVRVDGAHVNIVIPLLVGLDYGLQISRTVNINLELSARNHQAPFATKSAHNSEARRLGIIISGTRAAGPQKGTKFTHWLQSPKIAAIGKAEKLIKFLNRSDNAAKREMGPSKFVVWSGKSFLNISEPEGEKVCQPMTERPERRPVNLQSDFDRSLYEMLLRMTKGLQRLSISWKIRTTPSIRSYFKVHTVESIATMIARAIRPQVASILLSTEEFTVSRLLSLGGDINDPSQGVYADIVTNVDPSYFRIYVGAASSVGGRRYAGLRRRIQEHLRYAKTKLGHAQSGIPHCNEMTMPGANPNFAVLVRFSEAMPVPLIHVAEALMTIFFASWDNQVFKNLRPSHLAECRDWGLNKANPLDFAIVSIYDRTNSKARLVENARKRAARNQMRRIENARAGHVVRLYLDRCRNNFRFKLCAETIMIPTTLGNTLGLKSSSIIKVECDIRAERHPSAYALKATWESNAGRLGICLLGQYGQGPCKGQEFKKWIQCGSNVAVARAERIIRMLEE
ncbi:hypothetical protein MAJ_10655, partial [Metarhizium majus ARSEF 297]